MRAMRLTPRQRFLHGFIEYIHKYVIPEFQYEAVLAAEKKRLANEKRRLARKKAR